MQKEQSLITLESDKATMEIPSPETGVVRSLGLKLGDKVSQGSLILQLPPRHRDPPHPLPLRQPLLMRARPISNATCLCSVPDPVAIRPRFALRTSV